MKSIKEVHCIKTALETEEGQVLLKCLEQFCFADNFNLIQDPHLVSQMAGRRDVYLALVRVLKMDDKEVENLTSEIPNNDMDNFA